MGRPARILRSVESWTGCEPVTAPLPHIPSHGEKAITVPRKSIHRAGPRIPILRKVVLREITLPNVAHMRSFRNQHITPGVKLLLKAAARGIFPLRFRRQRLSRPRSIGAGIVPRHVN